jgi:mannan endo-1,4-beta-mannosidase
LARRGDFPHSFLLPPSSRYHLAALVHQPGESRNRFNIESEAQVSNRATRRSSSRRAIAASAGAVIAAAGLLLSVMQGLPGAARADTATPLKTRALSTKPMTYLGVYEQNELKSYSQVQQFGQAVGRAPNLVLYFLGWGSFNVTFAKDAYAHNAFLVTDLDPKGVSIYSIIAGKQDAHLRLIASEVKSFGHPVVISFGHEMNGAFNTWGYKHVPPQKFIQAWRRIVTIFRSAGASNVTWLWTVNYESAGEGAIQNWWPGAAYVNWVGIDGYYYGKNFTFGNLFRPTMATIRTFTKEPILISETAAGQVAGQAGKIDNLFTGASRNGVLGFLWFDLNQKGSYWKQRWRIESHPTSVGTFKKDVKQYIK